MIKGTDVLFDLFSFSDASASEFRFSDIILLSNIRFIETFDAYDAEDFVSVSVDTQSVEFLGMEDSLFFGITVNALDVADVLDVAAVTVSTLAADNADVDDELSAEVQSNSLESIALLDSASLEVSLTLDEFVSVNEEVLFGQQTFMDVNNVVVPDDAVTQDYSDKNTADLAGAEDATEMVLRVRQSSTLGGSLLGNITLGVRHD